MKKAPKHIAPTPAADAHVRLDLSHDCVVVKLRAVDNLRAAAHVLERRPMLAVNAALGCGRPLLVRGEPGVGKSQLARAVAQELGRVFISRFIDARTEAHELMASHDAVTRLAEAQAWGRRTPSASVQALDRRRYISPGPLWWAFDWKGAEDHVEEAEVKVPPPPFDPVDGRVAPEHGSVLLLDEIDKADMSVPNGLLEALGHREFSVPGRSSPVRITGVAPLVVLTTNDDRVLPDALIRRCVVLWLRVPEPGDDFEQTKTKDPPTDPLIKWLVRCGHEHFGAADPVLAPQYLPAAVQVVEDRRSVHASRHCPPGLAEYIDLLAALQANPGHTVAELSPFFLHKHVDPERRR